MRAARGAGADVDELAALALRDRHRRRHARRRRRALSRRLEHVRRRRVSGRYRGRTSRRWAPRRGTSRRTCTGARTRLPLRRGPARGRGAPHLAELYGSIVQAAWSFQLAARARGLGSSWTTYHLDYEREVAELIGIPYGEVTQVALIPVAYSIGTDFRPAQRRPLESVLHWNRW